MITSNSKLVRIEQALNLNKDQKRFNQLIKKIDALKQQLIDWQSALPKINQQIVSEYMPLAEAFNAHRLQLVYLLDNSYSDKLFKKRDREKLRQIIQTLVEDLMTADCEADLQILHDKYSDVSLDEKKQEASDFMKFMLEDMLDVEVPKNIDINNPEQLHEFMQEHMQQEQARADAQQKSQEHRAKRKKTAKQQQKQAQQEAEALNVRKTLQEVYRKLAAALHPDREQNPLERNRKTELMQRVNVAYNNKDLMQLLELQLEVEQIDQRHINSISEERLKYFNKLLKEQSDELQQEIDELKFSVATQFNLSVNSRFSARDLMRFLHNDIDDLKYKISGLKQDLRVFQDPHSLKVWLKHFQLPRKPGKNDFLQDDFDPIPF